MQRSPDPRNDLRSATCQGTSGSHLFPLFLLKQQSPFLADKRLKGRGKLRQKDLLRYRQHDCAAVLCAFDLIEVDFEDLRRAPLKRHETGPRMSKAVIHGDTVYLAGIVADSPKGKSVAEQTKSILSQIDDFLAVAGTNKTKLLSANIWITDMASFAEMNSVWDAWVSPGNTPARATVEAKLASPDYKVEIMVVAAR